jgi:hypothetical protein
MTRAQFIERVRRQIYNGQPSDDATITVGLVNNYLSDAIAFAAKTNYKDNVNLDGIGYLNGSFYTRFTNLSISASSPLQWKVTLPEVPLGIGRNEGISTIELKDEKGNITRPFIPISESQKTYYQDMRPIPGKILYFYEGGILYILSATQLNPYTINVTMASGGDISDLSSTLNVPPDYFPIMMEYLQRQLLMELSQKVDVANDGLDAPNGTT